MEQVFGMRIHLHRVSTELALCNGLIGSLLFGRHSEASPLTSLDDDCHIVAVQNVLANDNIFILHVVRHHLNHDVILMSCKLKVDF